MSLHWSKTSKEILQVNVLTVRKYMSIL